MEYKTWGCVWWSLYARLGGVECCNLKLVTYPVVSAGNSLHQTAATSAWAWGAFWCKETAVFHMDDNGRMRVRMSTAGRKQQKHKLDLMSLFNTNQQGDFFFSKSVVMK